MTSSPSPRKQWDHERQDWVEQRPAGADEQLTPELLALVRLIDVVDRIHSRKAKLEAASTEEAA